MIITRLALNSGCLQRAAVYFFSCANWSACKFEENCEKHESCSGMRAGYNLQRSSWKPTESSELHFVKEFQAHIVNCWLKRLRNVCTCDLQWLWITSVQVSCKSLIERDDQTMMSPRAPLLRQESANNPRSLFRVRAAGVPSFRSSTLSVASPVCLFCDSFSQNYHRCKATDAS